MGTPLVLQHGNNTFLMDYVNYGNDAQNQESCTPESGAKNGAHHQVENDLKGKGSTSEVRDDCLEKTRQLGGNSRSPAAHLCDQPDATTEKAKSNLAESSLFDKKEARQIWGISQTAINVLRTVSTVLNEVDGIDGDVRLALNLTKTALGLFLSSYDLGNGFHTTDKSQKDQEYYKNQFTESLEKAQKALGRVSKPSGQKVVLKPDEKNGVLGEVTDHDITDEVTGYVKKQESEAKLANHSSAVKGQQFIDKLGNAKDVMSLISSACNLFRSMQGCVPILATGAGAAVAGTVAAGLTLGIGVAFSSYEIVQGYTAIKMADQERLKFKEKEKAFKAGAAKDNPLNPSLKAGIEAFFSKKIDNAKFNLGSAISRVIRGIAGLVVAAIGVAALVASMGNAAFVAAVVGGMSSALYFVGITIRINRNIAQAAANKEERERAEKLKVRYPDVDLFDNAKKGENLDIDEWAREDELNEAFQNKYFMAWSLAKQFEKDCINGGNRSQVNTLLQSLGLTKNDTDVLCLLPKGGSGNVAIIEKMIGLRMEVS